MPVHFEKCNDCCVWMEAGILAYKRCDRNFDCEHCPLDSVLQSEVPYDRRAREASLLEVAVPLPDGTDSTTAALLAPYASTVLHRDFYYSNSHVWYQFLPGGFCRLGLDAFLLRLLPDSADIITLAAGSNIEVNGPLGWIYANGITRNLASPVPGTIIRRNGAINNINVRIRNDAYNESWLAVLRTGNLEEAFFEEHDAAIAEERFRTQATSFLALAADALQNPGELGICLNDGGTQVESLEKALGEQAYWDIVQQALRPMG